MSSPDAAAFPRNAEVPVLITSAIRVSSNHTALTDCGERLRLTLWGIERWRQTNGVSQVVVCDGSGFDLTPLIQDLDGSPGRAGCEVITFLNDTDMVRSRGKGYGEGQIVAHALEASKVLREGPVFAKCTGKLWVENFKACRGAFNGTATFDYGGWLFPSRIETRFYITSRAFYERHLKDAYMLVDDGNGFYLEHAFLAKLGPMIVRDFIMYPPPKICGTSGSTGIEFRTLGLKPILRSLRSLCAKLIGFRRFSKERD